MRPVRVCARVSHKARRPAINRKEECTRRPAAHEPRRSGIAVPKKSRIRFSRVESSSKSGSSLCSLASQEGSWRAAVDVSERTARQLNAVLMKLQAKTQDAGVDEEVGNRRRRRTIIFGRRRDSGRAADGFAKVVLWLVPPHTRKLMIKSPALVTPVSCCSHDLFLFLRSAIPVR